MSETSSQPSLPIIAVSTGKVMAFGPNGEPSGFIKRPREEPVTVSTLGLEGDEQGDRVNHGGPDKAIHHYPMDHYGRFAQERPALAPLLAAPGGFGENISTKGWTEDSVCIGDRLRLGTAEVEMSQGRGPCWKLGHRFADPSMVERVTSTSRTGWYYRVIRPGEVGAGDSIALLDRPHPEWTVSRAFRALIVGEGSASEISELRDLPELSPSWRGKADKRLHGVQAAVAPGDDRP